MKVNNRPSVPLFKLVVSNVTFYVLFVLFTLFSALFFTIGLTLLRPIIGYRRTMKRLRRTISLYGNGVIHCCAYPFTRVNYVDHEESINNGPFIFVSNHRSFSDPFLMACLPVEAIQVVNVWPFSIPLLGIVARLAGYLSVNELPIDEFVTKGSELIRQGTSIIGFPEGTRSGDKAMGQFHSGMFHLALATQCTIVPLAISGNEYIPPRGSWILYPGVVKVHKLPALKWADYNHLTSFQLKNKVRALIEDELIRMEQ